MQYTINKRLQIDLVICIDIGMVLPPSIGPQNPDRSTFSLYTSGDDINERNPKLKETSNTCNVPH